MKRSEHLTTKEKALELNLNPTIYGVFAEIGAGQEVANHFFKAGAASDMIAKTISAYDMTVSDSIYGKTQKYVSKSRVESMLDVEYKDINESLSDRAAQKQFFVFANTIETINFHKTNQGQGWMGVRFQLTPDSPPSTVIIHLLLHNDAIDGQLSIVGKLGVNLIYSVFNYAHSSKLFVENLIQNLSTDQVEVNFIQAYGNHFDEEISLHMSLQLVKSGLTKMIMLGKNYEVLQPSNALYKKDIVLVRGRFRPPTKVTVEMFLRSQNQLISDKLATLDSIQPVAELTFNCFKSNTELVLDDFMKRSKLITELGYPLMITNFTYHHELIEFMQQRIRMSSLNIVLGLDNIRKVLMDNAEYNAHQGLLKLMLLASKMKTRIMIFPEIDETKSLLGLSSIELNEATQSLINFLQLTNRIYDLRDVDPQILAIRSDKVLQAILAKDSTWKEFVPNKLIPLLTGEDAYFGER